MLVTANWTKGPTGSGETDPWLFESPNLQTAVNLAESWDVPDSNTIIFHIRQDIYYAINPKSVEY